MARVGKDARGLTDKQARFVAEYLKDMVATKAAERAGYSPRSAKKYANELLNDARVQAALQEAMKARSERTQIDADYVLQQAVKLHERCMQEVEPFTDRAGKQIYDRDGRPLFVFNAAGAAKALELVGKHVGVMAFRDRVDLSNSDGSMAPRALDASKLSTEALKELMGVIDEAPEPDGG